MRLGINHKANCIHYNTGYVIKLIIVNECISIVYFIIIVSSDNSITNCTVAFMYKENID